MFLRVAYGHVIHSHTHFSLDIRAAAFRCIFMTQEEYVFKPKVWYMLKLGWVQFVAVFIILYAIMRKAEFFAFHFRILPTRVVSDIKPPKQQF